jgi:hypothetical protein
VARKTFGIRIALPALFAVLALALAPAVPASPGGGGGGGKTSCTRNAPGISIDNNWAWGQTGSWGLPGQQLAYGIKVVNYDIGCGSSSFVAGLSAPSGFSVSFPTNAISLKSSYSGYLWGNVTSPNAIADGDYPLTVTVQRTATPSSATSTSFYKVYSSDTVAPTLYWPNPGDGTTITGNSYNVVVSSRDDHAVKSVDLYIDNVFKSTTSCDDIAYSCSLSYKWALSGVSGQHTATFRSYDWLGNVGVLTTTFTVN